MGDVDRASAGAAATPQPEARAAPTGEVVAFPARQRPRGRPRVDRTPTPCTDRFETVVAAIAGITAREWPQAKAAARRRADADRRLSRLAAAVVGFHLEEMRPARVDARGRGHAARPLTWHATRTIAEALGADHSGVVRAHAALRRYGYLAERAVPPAEPRRGCRVIVERTVPCLVAAVMMVRENADDGARKSSPPGDDGAELGTIYRDSVSHTVRARRARGGGAMLESGQGRCAPR
jgi:hypothetical protein